MEKALRETNLASNPADSKTETISISAKYRRYIFLVLVLVLVERGLYSHRGKPQNSLGS